MANGVAHKPTFYMKYIDTNYVRTTSVQAYDGRYMQETDILIFFVCSCLGRSSSATLFHKGFEHLLMVNEGTPVLLSKPDSGCRDQYLKSYQALLAGNLDRDLIRSENTKE